MSNFNVHLSRVSTYLVITLGGLFSTLSAAQSGISIGGLSWTPITSGVTYTEAVKACAGSISGKTGWRLPLSSDLSAISREDRDTLLKSIGPTGHDRDFVIFWTGDEARGEGGRHSEPKIYRWAGNAYGSKGFWDQEHKLNRSTCVRDEKAASKSAPAASNDRNVAPATQPKTNGTNASRSAGGAATLGLNHADTSAADKAKSTQKRESEARKKAEADRQWALIVKAEADAKAKRTAEARLNAKGTVVNQVISDDSLEEHQTKTWCERRVPEFKQRLEKGGDKLISMGACSCKRGGAVVTLNKLFKCEFAVSFQQLKPSGAR